MDFSDFKGNFFKPGEHHGGSEGFFPAPSREVKSEALEKDHKNTKAGNDQGSSRGISRFICLGCIFLKSQDMFCNIGLTFSIT